MAILHQKFRLHAAKAKYPHLPNSLTTIREKGNDFHGLAVYTDEAHLAYAGSRLHSSNTAELSSIVEALSFLGPHGPVVRDSRSCMFHDSRHAASICLGTVQSRASVHLGLACQRLSLRIELRLRFTTQHIYSHAQNLGNECADHNAALGTLVWCQIKTFPHVGHTLHLTPIRVSLLVTTLVMSWKSYVMLEQRAYLPPNARSKVSVLFNAVSLRDLPR